MYIEVGYQTHVGWHTWRASCSAQAQAQRPAGTRCPNKRNLSRPPFLTMRSYWRSEKQLIKKERWNGSSCPVKTMFDCLSFISPSKRPGGTLFWEVVLLFRILRTYLKTFVSIVDRLKRCFIDFFIQILRKYVLYRRYIPGVPYIQC